MNPFVHIQQVTCERFKPFRNRTPLELVPLTIVFGKNGSGKSALLRLVPQLLEGLRQRNETGLPLQVPQIVQDRHFSDLVQGHSARGVLKLGLQVGWATKTLRLDWTLLGTDGTGIGRQLIDSFAVLEEGGEGLIFKWDEESDAAPMYRTTVVRVPGLEFQAAPVLFQGLLPAMCSLELLKLPRESAEWFRSTVEVLRQLPSSYSYLGPVRAALPSFLERDDHAQVQPLAVDGVNAGHLFFANQRELMPRVQAFFEQRELGGRALEISKQDAHFAIRLRKDGLPSPLGSVGLGMAQVFPLVVQRAMPAPKSVPDFPTPARLEIVEEPESHLHPAAHGAVADLYVSGVKEPGTRFLLETHSELFLLRLRRRIAEGVLSPEDIRLYWVDDDNQTLQRVILSEEGDVENWPDGVFAYDFEELKLLRQAQRQQRGRT